MSTERYTTVADGLRPNAGQASVKPVAFGGRIEFLGRYKGLLAVLVVLIHTGITYGAVGSWIYGEPHDVMWIKVAATCIGSFSQSFVLGAFFFLSAYFLPRSLAKKGPTRLLIDRAVRLGVPFVLYYFVGQPLLVMAVENLGYGNDIPFGPYFGSGPLWFVEALFVFTAVYVMVWVIRRRRGEPLFLTRGIPSNRVVWAFIGVAALLGFLTRIPFPIGWSIHNQQLGFFPMYVMLFAAGIKAGRENWLDSIASVPLRPWGTLSMAAILVYLPMMIFGGALDDPTPFLGSITWQSGLYAAWEAVAGTSLFITTIVFFSRRRWSGRRVSASFGGASFAIYFFHAFVITLGAIALSRVVIYPPVKWMIIAIAGVCVPWVLSIVLKRIPGVRSFL